MVHRWHFVLCTTWMYLHLTHLNDNQVLTDFSVYGMQLGEHVEGFAKLELENSLYDRVPYLWVPVKNKS